MNERKFDIGDGVICSESGVTGVVIKFYTPTSCEEQTMVQTDDGRKYHAPTRLWEPYAYGNKATTIFCDDVVCGVDLGSGPDMTGNLLNPYGEYVVKFAQNHGISIAEAYKQPMCKARLAYFNSTGQ